MTTTTHVACRSQVRGAYTIPGEVWKVLKVLSKHSTVELGHEALWYSSEDITARAPHGG